MEILILSEARREETASFSARKTVGHTRVHYFGAKMQIAS